ncbi:MAG TPA: signal peptidase I [Opitutus sp.]|nr:signal peptidase I [Opitutus sp.]
MALGIYAVATGAEGERSLRFKPPQAYPVETGRETRVTEGESPHSALSAEAALAAARAVAAQIKGAEVLTVMPTGSMRPMFDERAFIVVEPTPFEELKVGDIITYAHPELHVLVVHRILEKMRGGYWTKGDHNERPDDVYVTRKNYMKRVFAIIYARENGRNVDRIAAMRLPKLNQ